VEGFESLGLDARGLVDIHVVALHEEAQRAIANVLVMMATEQVVEHAFTQRALGVRHGGNLQRIEYGLQDRQTRREDAPAVRLDALDVELFHIAELEQFAFQPGDAFGIDLAVAEPAALDRQADGADGPRGADCLLPAEASPARLDAHQLQSRGRIGLDVACGSDLAVREEASGTAHAAHLQALAQPRIEALADDELGAAAADIHHQPLSGCAMEGMRDTRVDQARLLASGDDLDLMVENLFRAANELRPVAGFAQRVGADDAHRALGQ